MHLTEPLILYSEWKKIYTKILVPYDISMQAGKAFDHAIKLAEAINGGKRFFL